MSNLDEVRQNIVRKFFRAIGDTDVGEAALPFIKLALVDQQAAFEAILWQRQAANAVDLYHEPDTDTAEAMVKAVNRLTAQLAQVRTELADARVGHGRVDWFLFGGIVFEAVGGM